MDKYRAIRYFMIESKSISISINPGSEWEHLGCKNGYITLHRKGVFVDIPKDCLEINFIELKEQKDDNNRVN